jgi:hypothetical protein
LVGEETERSGFATILALDPRSRDAASPHAVEDDRRMKLHNAPGIAAVVAVVMMMGGEGRIATNGAGARRVAPH